jgi:hypothetical protein
VTLGWDPTEKTYVVTAEDFQTSTGWCPHARHGPSFASSSQPGPHPQAPVPGTVPLLAMKSAMSMCRLSTCRFLMQPTKCRIRTGKFSGRSGTPPRSRGPVRSRDLWKQKVT